MTAIIQQVFPENSRDENQSAIGGPLSDLEKPGFDYNVLQYPTIMNEDFPDAGHYLVFYINVPELSYWNNGPQNGPPPVANRGNTDATRFGLRKEDSSGIFGDNLESSPGLNQAVVNQVMKNKTIRTTTAIALYIPPTMIFAQHPQWGVVSLSEALGGVGDVSAAIGLFEAGKYGAAGAALSGIAGGIINRAGTLAGHLVTGSRAHIKLLGDIKNAALAAAGIADNPQNFLLFKQMEFRKFEFDFLLTPENAKETSVINEIIRQFRLHSVPEVLFGSIGRFFVPPSMFDIDIIHNGKRNQMLPLISTCACTSVNIDYAAAGQWGTTYDGMPQQIRMTLNFQESEILTKSRISEGF